MVQQAQYWFEPPKMWMPMSLDNTEPSSYLEESSRMKFSIEEALAALGDKDSHSVASSESFQSEVDQEERFAVKLMLENSLFDQMPTSRPVKGPSAYQFAKRSRNCRSWTSFVFTISLEDVLAYGLVPKLIGHDGEIMKSIATSCNAKLRIRGRGSRFREVSGPNGSREADVPLQIFLGAPDQEKLLKAREMVIEVLNRQSFLYGKYCERLGRPPIQLYVEGARKLVEQQSDIVQ